jgi:hypothetical protein
MPRGPKRRRTTFKCLSQRCKLDHDLVDCRKNAGSGARGRCHWFNLHIVEAMSHCKSVPASGRFDIFRKLEQLRR